MKIFRMVALPVHIFIPLSNRIGAVMIVGCHSLLHRKKKSNFAFTVPVLACLTTFQKLTC